jgi:hypothetical protein
MAHFVEIQSVTILILKHCWFLYGKNFLPGSITIKYFQICYQKIHTLNGSEHQNSKYLSVSILANSLLIWFDNVMVPGTKFSVSVECECARRLTLNFL